MNYPRQSPLRLWLSLLGFIVAEGLCMLAGVLIFFWLEVVR